MRKKKEKVIIGHKERIDMPEMHLKNIEAKVDTGAYSVALHCHDYWVEVNKGAKELCFHILDPEHPGYNKKVFRFRDFTLKQVKSSSGHFERRFVIKTPIILGGKEILADVSLTDRASMRYPVLIGRKVLRKGYLVDVNKKFIADNHPR